MSIINDNFMLQNKTAKKIYKAVKDLPIIDYHCHLQPRQIAENHRFKNAYDLFLSGDHYKWRQMRTFGIDEEYITGNAPDYEKFKAYAKVMPYLIGNPLFHWTQLELKRYFGIDEILSEETCDAIWEKCNKMLAQDDFCAQSLITRSNVEVVCTTDDPADDLHYHEEMKDFSTKILPTFRPDKAIEITKDTFLPYLEAQGITEYGQLLKWLEERIEYFNSKGCRLSDHGLDYVPYGEGDAEAVFKKKLAGEAITDDEAEAYKTAVLAHCAREYAKHGWTLQLHVGAIRNNNAKMYAKLGADTGFDSINDICIAEKMSKFLDLLNRNDELPRTILYCLNPKDNYVLGTMLGNFQGDGIKGKIQFGSGWWFNDNRDGMVEQMKALSNLGMISCFVGMLTDSRSFVSYPRHEYFRRIMCNLLGTWAEEGEYPKDIKMLTKIAADICYYNAKNYFGF